MTRLVNVARNLAAVIPIPTPDRTEHRYWTRDGWRCNDCHRLVGSVDGIVLCWACEWSETT